MFLASVVFCLRISHFVFPLFPLCLVKFMFPNIPCGTSGNSARPASLCAMFHDDRSPLRLLHFRSFRIAVNDERPLRVVINHFCQVFLLMSKNSLLENLAFPDDLFFILLTCIIVSDLFSFEMTIPSVASCDSGRTHPPFLASFRPPKNLQTEKRPFKK